MGEITLVVEISSKADDALAGEDAEYLALMLGEFWMEVVSENRIRREAQLETVITYLVERLCKMPPGPPSGRPVHR